MARDSERCIEDDRKVEDENPPYDNADMKYAKFCGEWGDRRGNWRWQKLGNAAPHGAGHRHVGSWENTRQLTPTDLTWHSLDLCLWSEGISATH